MEGPEGATPRLRGAQGAAAQARRPSLTLAPAALPCPPCGERSQAQLLQAIDDAGFEGEALGRGDATSMLLTVCCMTDASCAAAVEAVLSGEPGVLDASANMASGKAEVRGCACACVPSRQAGWQAGDTPHPPPTCPPCARAGAVRSESSGAAPIDPSPG